MKIRFKKIVFSSIKTKISVLVGVSTLLVIALLITYIYYLSEQTAITSARETTQKEAIEYSNKIKANLEQSLDATKILVQSFEGYQNIRQYDRRSVYDGILRNILLSTPDYIKVRTIWEPYSIDNLDTAYADNELGNSGRFSVTYYKEGEEPRKEPFTGDMESQLNSQPYYGNVKQLNRPLVLTPQYINKKTINDRGTLASTIVVPIQNNGNFVGIVSVDINMENVDHMIDTLKLYESGYGFLLSNDATFISHKNIEMSGKAFSELYPDLEEDYNITQNIKQGKAFSFIENLNNGEGASFVTFVPVNIGNATTWAFALIIPVDEIIKDAKTNNIILIISGIIGVLILISITFYVARQIAIPLQQTTYVLDKISKGDIDLPDRLRINTGDELNNMAGSVNALIDGLRKTSEFANHIGQGNLDAEFEPLSNKDVLGNSLLQMRQSLQLSREGEDKRKREDQTRNWTTQGIAKFSDILRQTNNNLQELSFNVMRNLVDYLNANQGGLFILNNDDPYNITLELKAAIAYNRRKFHKKSFGIKEGLIGACALEKETIYLDEIPQDYIEITSGLGKATPKVILLTPLKSDLEVLGVIEIASFNKFEKYEIEFVEKVAENIASSIAAVKINERTTKLLEQSKRQSEEMASQEEEMRQNLEELQATQEEAARRSAEMTGILKGLNDTFYVMELNMKAIIQEVNDNFLTLYNTNRNKVIGQSHRSFTDVNSQKEYPNGYDGFWDELRNGTIKTKEHLAFIQKDKTEVWISETYIPILDTNEHPYKVLFVGNNVSEAKKQEKEILLQSKQIAHQEKVMRDKMKQLQDMQTASALREAEMASIIRGLEASFLVTELETNGNIISMNQRFMELLRYTKEQVTGKNYFAFVLNIKRTEEEEHDFWNELNAANSVKDTHLIDTGSSEIWITETFTPILNKNNELIKVLNVATDVTESKLHEQEIKQLLIESEKKAKILTNKEKELNENLDKMQQLQNDLAEQKNVLEQSNQRMKINEDILKKAFEKTKSVQKKSNDEKMELQKIIDNLKKEHKILTQQNDELKKNNS